MPSKRRAPRIVIRSGRLDPDWASVDRRLLTTTGRAINAMIHYSGYNLVYIEPDFTVEHREHFDTCLGGASPD